MSSFSAPLSPLPPPTPPPPPPPPPPRSRRLPPSSATEASRRTDDVDRLLAVATDGLSWCIRRYRSIVTTTANEKKKNHDDDVLRLALDALVVASAGLAALGLASTLPPSGKTFAVNFCGFAYPASATILLAAKRAMPHDDDDDNDNDDNHSRSSSSSSASSTYSGYWVLFGLTSVFDSILPKVTPYYFFSKACLLAWGASSAYPYGGRLVTSHMIELVNKTSSNKDNNNNNNNNNDNNDNNNDNNDDDPVRRIKLAAITVSRTGFAFPPMKPSTLAVAAVAASFAAATLALGIFPWLVFTADSYFSSRSTRVQRTVCAVAGALWPLYATLVSLARTASAGRATAAGVGGGDGGGGGRGLRQGPAAVQWLSYWPMFAFLLLLDPVIGDWVPHYYSCKLVMLALLALPQTRGAYLITSIVLCSNDAASTTTTATTTTKENNYSVVAVGENMPASAAAAAAVTVDVIADD